MKIFYIFRHGLATHSQDGYGDKILTAEILPEGIPAIQRLATYLETITTDYNVSSQLIRCRQTAEIVTAVTGKQFMFDKRLNELLDEESCAQLRQRVSDFAQEIKNSVYESILICTHGAVIAALRHLIVDGRFSGEDLGDFTEPGELLIIDKSQVEIKNFNA